MAIELRPYQREAVEAIMADLATSGRVLLQAATGAGKTIIFCEVIRRFLAAQPGLGIVVMAHRQELVTQAHDKLRAVWPASGARVGLACAGVGAVDTSAQVVIGSVQTLARRDWRGKKVGLLIVDEAHHVPPLEAGGQYHQVIAKLTEAYPALKCLGVTATPFRLDNGFIFGRSPSGRTNFFDRLNCQIGMDDLIQGGFLAPYRAKEPVDVGGELRKIAVAAGEYNTKQLSSLMGNVVHVRTAVRAYEKYGEGRHHCLVFGVTIEHATRLAQAFSKAGFAAGVIHSRLPAAKRAALLQAFEGGALKVLCNVGVLTEGWDCPQADLVLLCRPTMSTALYVQMVGRGMRLAPGKRDVLILDLANNFRRHGHPGVPNITVPDFQGGARRVGVQVCPECHEVIGVGLEVCPCCGHEFTEGGERERQEPMEAKRLGRMREVGAAGAPPPGQARVITYLGQVRTSRAGNRMLVLEARLADGRSVAKWLDFGGAAPNGYALTKARAFWRRFAGGSAVPASLGESIERLAELRLPELVTIRQNKDGYNELAELVGNDPLDPGVKRASPVFFRNDEYLRFLAEEKGKQAPLQRPAAPALAQDGPGAAPGTVAVKKYGAAAKTSRAGHRMLVISAQLEDGTSVAQWLDIEGTAGNKYVRGKAQRFWRKFSAKRGAVPVTVQEALGRVQELALPPRLTVLENARGFMVAQELEG